VFSTQQWWTSTSVSSTRLSPSTARLHAKSQFPFNGPNNSHSFTLSLFLSPSQTLSPSFCERTCCPLLACTSSHSFTLSLSLSHKLSHSRCVREGAVDFSPARPLIFFTHTHTLSLSLSEGERATHCSPARSLTFSLSLSLSFTSSLSLSLCEGTCCRLLAYTPDSISLTPSLSRSLSLSQTLRLSQSCLHAPHHRFHLFHWQTNTARIRQSRPDSDLDFQAKVLRTLHVVPSWPGSGSFEHPPRPFLHGGGDDAHGDRCEDAGRQGPSPSSRCRSLSLSHSLTFCLSLSRSLSLSLSLPHTLRSG